MNVQLISNTKNSLVLGDLRPGALFRLLSYPFVHVTGGRDYRVDGGLVSITRLQDGKVSHRLASCPVVECEVVGFNSPDGSIDVREV